MSNEDNIDDGMPDDRLRWALRDLRRDVAPARDLWPSIATRIETGMTVAGNASASRSGPRRFASLALAASLLLAVGIAWQLRSPQQAGQPTAGLIRIEARAMTREYDAALHELQASVPATAQRAEHPGLRELDRSAAQIRTALARDPDARFLLERLRHTYSLRLALTQRAALS